MTITTRLYTFFSGRHVGTDRYGNRYYVQKHAEKGRLARRWVLYNGIAEPSKVPPEWHGWLHYTMDTPPTERNVTHHSWEKPHLPNLTGTQGAYLPEGHLQKSGKHAPTVSEIEPWVP